MSIILKPIMPAMQKESSMLQVQLEQAGTYMLRRIWG